MRRERELRVGGLVVTMPPDYQTMPGMLAIVEINRIQSERSSPMPGGYTTCTAMFGNGFRTGMIQIIIPPALLPIPKALLQETDLGSFAEAVGATALPGCAQRIVPVIR